MRIDNPVGSGAELTGSFSGSFLGDGSQLVNIQSASFATTASYVKITNLLPEGIISSSNQLQELNHTTGSLSSSLALLSSSFEDTSGSFSDRLTDLQNFSSSLDATFATDAEVFSAVSSLNAATSSYALQSDISGAFTATSSSLAIDISDNTTALEGVLSQSIGFNDRITGLEFFSTSLDDTFATEVELNNVSSSVKTFITDADTALSTSLALDISNNDGRLNTIEGKTLFSGSSQVDLASVTNNSTTNVTEGTNLYYLDSRVKTKLNTEEVISGSTQILTLVSIDEDNMVTNSDTKLPTQQSVKTYVDGKVADLVDSAPGTLDTLNELAAALGDDANFSTTVSTAIGGKVSQSLEILSGDGLTGGGNLTTSRTLAVDSTVLRTTGFDIVSGSSQVTSLLPSGIVSGSSQVNADSITNFDTNVKAKLNNDGVISGSIETDPFPYTGSAIISGSLNVIGDLLQNGAAIQTDPFPYTGSAIISGSGEISGSLGLSYPVYTPGAGAWSVGGNLITGRKSLAGAGTQNAGLAFGGYSPLACTEEYNGASWSTGGALIIARDRLAGAGTQNAGLAFGGATPATFNGCSCTEEYNGTSWSAGGALSVSRYTLGGAGTQNAALAFGGYGGYPNTAGNCTEEYNGASWSTGGALITTRGDVAGAGTQNAGLAFGGATGYPAVFNLQSEEYNGTSWSAGGSLITGRSLTAGAGTQNAALSFGGYGIAPTFFNASCTEEYNGTSWSAGGALITGRFGLAGAGEQNSALAFGGGPSVTCTEEYSSGPGTINFTKTFDYSATTGQVSASGSFSGSFQGDGSGLTGVVNATSASFATNSTSASFAVSASHVIGGVDPFPYTGSAIISGSLNVIGDLLQNGAAIETDPFPYTGSAIISGSGEISGSLGLSYPVYTPGAGVWSVGGNLITGIRSLAGAGTQNAGLAFGGYDSGLNTVSCTEEYDGSSWSAGGALITARCNLAGAGTQNAALAFGGRDSGFNTVSCTEEYNGTSWSAGGALITARNSLAGAGTQNAGLAFGGSDSGFNIVSCTEEYDGSSWSAGGALSTARELLAGAGTQNAGLAFGGNNPAVSCTEEYNGSSWSAGGALITARLVLAGAGTQNAGLAMGGGSGTLSCTEEYDGSSWSAGGALITARNSLAGAGTQNSALAFGGFVSPSIVACTEEYSPGPGTTNFTKTFDYSATTGQTTVSCLIETSAERYKSNIQPMESQLSKVMQLQPVEFDWKGNKKHDIGFVADSVKDVYPNLVSTNDKGEVEGMNYSKLVSALVKSIQEQQEQINLLSNEIKNLKNN